MSKFAVRTLGECLDVELRPHGASVTVIAPGFIETEIFKINNQGVYDKDLPVELPQFLIASPDKAARKIIKAVLKRKPSIVITKHAVVLEWLNRYFPVFSRFIAKKFAEKGVI